MHKKAEPPTAKRYERVQLHIGDPQQGIKLAVDLKTAAQMISVCRRTIENYIAAKLLPARKVGRRTLIRVADLEAFLRRDQPSPVALHDDR